MSVFKTTLSGAPSMEIVAFWPERAGAFRSLNEASIADEMRGSGAMGFRDLAPVATDYARADVFMERRY